MDQQLITHLLIFSGAIFAIMEVVKALIDYPNLKNKWLKRLMPVLPVIIGAISSPIMMNSIEIPKPFIIFLGMLAGSFSSTVYEALEDVINGITKRLSSGG